MKSNLKLLTVLFLLTAIVATSCGSTTIGGDAPTSKTDSGSAAVEKTIYVGPERVDCEGAGPQKCMLVKEEPDGEWTLFYDQIEGFAYEEGYEYVLRILEEQVENPPADASSIRWVLVEIVSKTKVEVQAPDVEPGRSTDSGPITPPASSLEGTVWTLDSYLNSQGQMVNVLPGKEITAEFQAGEVRGNAGCNTYFGNYQVDGDSLTIGPLAMTEMYCAPEDLMQQESDYLAALSNAASYQVTDTALEIADASGQTILTFSVPGTVEPAPILGTFWKLVSYNNGQGGISSVLVGTEITANFGEDETLSGSAGCNNYTALYKIDGNEIEIGAAASTRMMCSEPDGIMKQEGIYLAMLEGSTAFQVEGNILTMSDDAGKITLIFQASETTPLVGTRWVLNTYNDGKQALVSPLADTEITANFGEDGTLSGSAGCNSYSTSYEAQDGAITVGPIASTMMMCSEPEGIIEQEAAYLAALEAATHFVIEGDTLELQGTDDTRLVIYTAVAETTGEGLSEEALMNMEYKSEWTESGVAPLVDGAYEEEIAPGSASKINIWLNGPIAYGQLNRQDAAAVILATSGGGSGTFIDLAVVVEQDGQPVNVATTSLGDRAQVNSLQIAGNEIVVEMITHGPNDPMCCPSQQVVQTYELQGDQLIQTSSRTIETSTELVGVVWKWEKFLESNDRTIIVENPDQYTLEFLPDGQLAILADCNRVGGTYTVQGKQLTIQLGPSTMAACPSGSLENEYLRLLGEVVSYTFEGEKLALALRYDDTGVMTFQPDR